MNTLASTCPQQFCVHYFFGTLHVRVSSSSLWRVRESVMILPGGVTPTWAVSPHLDKPPTLASNPISSEGSACGAPAVIQL